MLHCIQRLCNTYDKGQEQHERRYSVYPVHDELSKVGVQTQAAFSQEGCEGRCQGVPLELGRPVQGQAEHGHSQNVIALAHHIHLHICTSWAADHLHTSGHCCTPDLLPRQAVRSATWLMWMHPEQHVAGNIPVMCFLVPHQDMSLCCKQHVNDTTLLRPMIRT